MDVAGSTPIKGGNRLGRFSKLSVKIEKAKTPIRRSAFELWEPKVQKYVSSRDRGQTKVGYLFGQHAGGSPKKSRPCTSRSRTKKDPTTQRSHSRILRRAPTRIARPSAPPPPRRTLESPKKILEKRSNRRRVTKSTVPSSAAFKLASSNRLRSKLKTAPTSAAPSSYIRLPFLSSLTPKNTTYSPKNGGLDDSVRKACARMVQMRAQQISNTLRQVLRSEQRQNRELSVVNERKSRLWKKVVALKKVQQEITTKMIEAATFDEMVTCSMALELRDRMAFQDLLTQHGYNRHGKDDLPGIVRLQIWGKFYDDVVLPLIVKHDEEDRRRIEAWKKLAPTVNMRMSLKSMINLLQFIQDRLSRNAYWSKSSGKSRWTSPAKLKAHLDKHTPIPLIDREFIRKYL